MTIADRIRAVAAIRPTTAQEIAEIIYPSGPTRGQVIYVHSVIRGNGPEHWRHYRQSEHGKKVMQARRQLRMETDPEYGERLRRQGREKYARRKARQLNGG